MDQKKYKLLTNSLENAEEILKDVFNDSDEIDLLLVDDNSWGSKELLDHSQTLREIDRAVKSLNVSINKINEHVANILISNE